MGADAPLVVVLRVRTDDQSGVKRLSISRDGTDHGWQSDWPGELAELLAEFADPNRMMGARPRTAGSQRLTIGAESESSVPASTPAKVIKLTEVRVKSAEALLGETVLDQIRTAMGEGRQVRLALRIDASDPAWNLPWEYLQPDLQRSLVLTPGCGVARIVDASHGSSDTPGLGSGPRDRATVKAVDLASDGDDAFAELRAWLQRQEPILVGGSVGVCVVVGHGQPPGDTSAGAVEKWGPADLQRAIQDACGRRWPSLVVLVACQSARTEDALPSVAAALVQAGAPAVVGMAGDLETVGVAPMFLDGLCSALDKGTSLFTAVAAGRAAVAMSGGLSQQFGLPVLTISTEELLGEQDVVPDEVSSMLSKASETLAVVEVKGSMVAGSVTGANVSGDLGPVGGVVHIAGSTIHGSVTGVRLNRR